MNIYNKTLLTDGGFQDCSGKPLANGWLTLELSQEGIISLLGSSTGQTIVSGIKNKLMLDGLGNLIPNQYAWSNALITPAGTYYVVKAYNSSGLAVFTNPLTWTIPNQTSVNVGILGGTQ